MSAAVQVPYPCHVSVGPWCAWSSPCPLADAAGLLFAFLLACCCCCCSHLQFGPTIVAGSVMGSHLNYFIPGYITKVLVMLLMLPMAWRTIDKARRSW